MQAPSTGKGKKGRFPGIEAPIPVEVPVFTNSWDFMSPQPRYLRFSLLFPFQTRNKNVAKSPATCSADVLSCQLNMVAATSSFASHPWGHNTFLFVVGVTTMPRVFQPSLWERGLRCSGPRGWHGGPPDVSSRSLTPRFRANQPGLPDRQGLWEETYSILSQHCTTLRAAPHDIPLFTIY